MAWSIRMGQYIEVGKQKNNMWGDPEVGESMNTKKFQLGLEWDFDGNMRWDTIYRDEPKKVRSLKNIRTSIKVCRGH